MKSKSAWVKVGTPGSIWLVRADTKSIAFLIAQSHIEGSVVEEDDNLLDYFPLEARPTVSSE